MINAFTFKLQEMDKVAQITETINFYWLSKYVNHFSTLYFRVDRELLRSLALTVEVVSLRKKHKRWFFVAQFKVQTTLTVICNSTSLPLLRLGLSIR